MLTTQSLAALYKLPQPVLSVYLETDPRDQNNQRAIPAYIAWLKSESKALARSLSESERVAFHAQLQRVERFLRDRAARERGLVIFAGSATWQELALRMTVRNELDWGKAAVTQLLELIVEHKRSCIVAVDLSKARFFQYEQSEIVEYPELRFQVDTSNWKRMEHGHTAPRPAQMAHGPQRDAFKQRMNARYLRLCKKVADHAKQLCARDGMFSIFLVGSMRLIEPIRSAMPAELQHRIALIAEDLGKMQTPELQSYLEPKIAEWEKSLTASELRRLLNGDSGTVVGIDETLAQIQRGNIRRIVFVRGLEVNVRKCCQCGLISRSPDSRCSSCGGRRQDTLLSDVLTEIARQHDMEVEAVEGEVAGPLMNAGGMGGWLRRPEKAYVVPSTSARL